MRIFVSTTLLVIQTVFYTSGTRWIIVCIWFVTISYLHHRLYLLPGGGQVTKWWNTWSLRGDSKFEKCTLSVNLTFRGWGSNDIDTLKCIYLIWYHRHARHTILFKALKPWRWWVRESDITTDWRLAYTFRSYTRPLVPPSTPGRVDHFGHISCFGVLSVWL